MPRISETATICTATIDLGTLASEKISRYYAFFSFESVHSPTIDSHASLASKSEVIVGVGRACVLTPEHVYITFTHRREKPNSYRCFAARPDAADVSQLLRLPAKGKIAWESVGLQCGGFRGPCPTTDDGHGGSGGGDCPLRRPARTRSYIRSAMDVGVNPCHFQGCCTVKLYDCDTVLVFIIKFLRRNYRIVIVSHAYRISYHKIKPDK